MDTTGHAAARAALSYIFLSALMLLQSCSKEGRPDVEGEGESTPAMEVLLDIKDGTYDSRGDRVTWAELAVTVNEGPDVPYILFIGIDGQEPVRKGILRLGRESTYRMDAEGDGIHTVEWTVEASVAGQHGKAFKSGCGEFRYCPFVPGRNDVTIRFTWTEDMSGGMLIPESGYPEWYPTPRKEKYHLILEYWPESSSMHFREMYTSCDGFILEDAVQEGNIVRVSVVPLSDGPASGSVVFRFEETEYDVDIIIPGAKSDSGPEPYFPYYGESRDISLRIDGDMVDGAIAEMEYDCDTAVDVTYAGEGDIQSVRLVHQGGARPERMVARPEAGSFLVRYRALGMAVLRAEVTLESGDTYYRDYSVSITGEGALSLTYRAIDGMNEDDWSSYAVFLYNRGRVPVELTFYSTVYSRGSFGSTDRIETFKPSGFKMQPGESVAIGTYLQLESFIRAHMMASFSWHIGAEVSSRWIQSCTLELTDMKVLIRQVGKDIPIYVNGKETDGRKVTLK